MGNSRKRKEPDKCQALFSISQLCVRKSDRLRWQETEISLTRYVTALSRNETKNKAERKLRFNNLKLVGNVGKQCHLACSLDCNCELSLVKSASAGNTSGKNLSSFRNELSELCYVLIIDCVCFILAEDANLLSSVNRTESGTLDIILFH